MSVERSPEGLRVSANGMEPVTVDMVVLATGMIAHSTNTALAGLCNTEVDAFGFLKPDHGVLHANGTTIDGISTPPGA
jgi:heterodisulfide reductase subunit A-like polyferredoxin